MTALPGLGEVSYARMQQSVKLGICLTLAGFSELQLG